MLKRTKSQIHRVAWLLSLVIIPHICVAADAPAKISLPPAAAQAPKIEKHDILIMNLSIHDQLIITRMSLDGSCRQFLRQSGGFNAVLPVANHGNDFAPAVSPDGRLIAFYSSRNGAVNLWVSDAAGMSQRPLTDSEASIAEFRPLNDPPIQFSPDGKLIAYLDSGNLWLSGVQGQNPVSLTHEQGVESFAWAPDGKHLAYTRFGSLRYVASSGAPDELLAADAANFPTLSFNPNAKSNEIFYFYNGVWKFNTQTKKRERMVGSFSFPNRVRSSLSGDTVAYVGFSPDVREEVFTVAPGKKTGTQVTQGGASEPVLSRDGKWLYFKRKGGLWRISTPGEKASMVYAASVFMVNAAQLEYAAAPGGCP